MIDYVIFFYSTKKHQPLNLEFIKYLLNLQPGFRFCYRMVNEITSLAIQHDELDVVKYMDEIYLDEDHRRSMIRYAVNHGKISSVKYFFEKYFNDNDDLANRLIMLSCEQQNIYITMYLINNGVKLHPENYIVLEYLCNLGKVYIDDIKFVLQFHRTIPFSRKTISKFDPEIQDVLHNFISHNDVQY